MIVMRQPCYWFCLCWSCEKISEVEEGGLLI